MIIAPFARDEIAELISGVPPGLNETAWHPCVSQLFYCHSHADPLEG